MKLLASILNPLLFFLMVAIIISCENDTNKADVIITNAVIWTGNEHQPYAEAMAIAGDSIIAVGSREDIKPFIGDGTEVNDLKGNFVTPGFIDSHLHLLMGGINLNSVQLRDAQTKKEFIERIAAYAQTKPPGTWIVGGDWDHENWGGELPTKEWIDSITPHHPVLVTRLDGHMSLANSVALALAGVDKQTADISGGEIRRFPNGEVTGLVKDNAMDLVSDVIPELTAKEYEEALTTAMRYIASKGVTSVQHMSASGHYHVLKNMRDRNALIIRIYAMYPLNKWRDLQQEIETHGRGDKWLKIGGLKGFVDGSLGSHTAAFFDPYRDTSSDRGFFVTPIDSLYADAKAADHVDLQVMIHAIGDRAIHELLDAYEKIEHENGKKDRRFRIEHAQHIAHSDIPRFAELLVIPSMQPYHAIDDGRWAEKLIGPERIQTSYAFKSLFDSNAKVAFGSDFFVAPPTPLEGIYAAVTRRTLDGENPEGWVPEQKISVEQALVAYTKNAAYASFDDTIKGTLEPGKLADFVIISEDITKVDPIDIKDLKILATYVGGKKVYDGNAN